MFVFCLSRLQIPLLKVYKSTRDAVPTTAATAALELIEGLLSLEEAESRGETAREVDACNLRVLRYAPLNLSNRCEVDRVSWG
jgi:hypothetical protein